MRLLLKQARLERENSCDDYVLQFQYNAADYAKALLTIEQHSVESILALGTNSQNEFQLLNRIKRMLAPERKAFNYRQQLGLLFIITLLGLGFTVILPKQQAKTIVEMKKPVAGNKSKDVSVFEKMIPAGVDLIKNLENIQQFKRITSSPDFKDKTKKIENAFSKVGNNLDAQIKPHIKQIEATELQIEDLLKHQNINGQNAIQLNEWQLKELGNADWAKIFTPALEESLKVLALPRIVGEDNWKMAELADTAGCT